MFYRNKYSCKTIVKHLGRARKGRNFTYIDSQLNLVRPNVCGKLRDHFENVGSINCVLNQLVVYEEDYYNVLFISDYNDFQVHLNQLLNSCFVKNYFRTGLLAFEANLDIQPGFNYYKAVIHKSPYLSKTQYKCLYAENQGFNEAMTKNLTNCDEIRSTTPAYSMQALQAKIS